MRYVRYSLEVGFCGCNEEGVMAFDDKDFVHVQETLDAMAQDHATSWEGDTRLYDEEEWAEMADDFYSNVYATWDEISEEEYKDEN